MVACCRSTVLYAGTAITRYMKFLASLLIVILPGIAGSNLFAQDTSIQALTSPVSSRSEVFVGTQIPLQFTAGYGFHFSDRISARAQAGFITKPYSGFIVDALEAFGLDNYLSRVIKKAFSSGTVLGIGPNYHFGKNYIGVYAQYINLKGGGISPADALSIYFKRDFTSFDVNALPAFQFSMQSNILNTGLLFGRQFQLKHPQLSINGEAGLSKIVASKNSFASNRTLIDATAFARNMYKEFDREMQSAYWKHGFIPSINVYLVYRIPVKKSTGAGE